MGASEQEALDQLLTDGRLAPRPRPRRPVLAPYVDNANALCWSLEDANTFTRAMVYVFESFGFLFTMETTGAPVWDTVGITIDMLGRTMYSKAERT